MGFYADRLRAKIKASGRSLYAIARDAGMDGSHLSRWMAGKTDISVARFDRLHEALVGKTTSPQDCQSLETVSPEPVKTVSPQGAEPRIATRPASGLPGMVTDLAEARAKRLAGR